MSAATRDIALLAFRRIGASFPHLLMTVDEAPRNVDVSVEIPAQPSLSLPVSLNLQNEDELHLNAAGLWVSWFPCTKDGCVQDFVSAVCGLLSGKYRVVEFYRGAKLVRATLQRPDSDNWANIRSRLRLHLPFGTKTVRVLQNAPVA
jgi:hypothetical protein